MTPALLAFEAPHGATAEFVVLFTVVLLGPVVVEKARIPGIIGLLLGGFLIGSHGLDLISSGNQTVPDLGQVGLLYLMFVAGLELDLGLLRSHRRSAVVFGVLTFLLPFVGGVIVGATQGWGAASALLLGSLLASHTLIVYPMVRDAERGADPAVATAVGATVLTDTLALVVLAGVSGTRTGSGSTAEVLGEIALGLAVLLVASLVVLPRIATWAFRGLGSDRTARYLISIVSFLAMASLGEVFGIEGIVGAFFAGLALNRLVPNEGPSMERIEFFGSAVFVPVFLVSVGLLLDPAVMVEPSTLGLAGLLILACIGGKALAALAGRAVLGWNGPEAGAVFSLTTPQAAATLAATLVGFDIGLFGTSVVNAVLVVILVSIVVSTVVMPRYLRQLPVPAAGDDAVGRRVLLAVTTSQPSASAVRLAGRLARPDSGVVDVLLARNEGQAPFDRAAIRALEHLALEGGLDGEVQLGVDRTIPHAAAHVAAGWDASLLVVDGTGEAGAGLVEVAHWAEAVTDIAPVPVVLLLGTSHRRTRRAVLLSEPRHPGDDGLGELAGRVAQRAGRGAVQEADPRSSWSEGVGEGDLVVVPLGAWDDLSGVPTPPQGALLAVVRAAQTAPPRPVAPLPPPATAGPDQPAAPA